MPNTRKQLCWARLQAALLCQEIQACLARTAGGDTESVPGKSSPGNIVFWGGGGGRMAPRKPRFLGDMYYMGPGRRGFLVFSDGVPEHFWADEKPKSEKSL